MKKVDLLKAVRELAHSAGAVLMKYYTKTHRIEHKPGAGIVTEADKAAEKVIMDGISRKFPDSSIITEESGEFSGKSSLCWVIDPLDGTSNYAHGFPWFCVSIGLLEDNVPKAGVIWNPVTKEEFSAQRKKGAYLNGKRIRVSKTKKVADSLLGTGFYYTVGKALRWDMEIFYHMTESCRAIRRPGSAALDLAYVACGRYDGFWERKLSSWDVAAGFLIVKEAGGEISNYSGKPTDIYEGQVVSSNGKIHQEMLQVIEHSTKGLPAQ